MHTKIWNYQKQKELVKIITYESSVIQETPVNLSGYSEKASFWPV